MFILSSRVATQRQRAVQFWFPLLCASFIGVATAEPSSGASMQENQSLIPLASTLIAQNVIDRHPVGQTLQRLFPASAAQMPKPANSPGWSETGITRADYLPLISGNVDFFKQHQNAEGAIIDPYEKKERQYSTPAFAQAAATLVAFAGRNDLLEPATRAFSFSLSALVNKTTADKHADFYIPMMMHAHRILAPRVDSELREKWAGQLRSLVPEQTYRDTGGRGNWNIVNVTGDAMRRKDGLVAPEQAEAQLAYIERSLERQNVAYTKFGLYDDHGQPLAYDAFPRLWLENMILDGAYKGAQHDKIVEFLTQGGLSTLLLFAPSGEWASGGRSAHHQWNEAEIAVIAEANARRWRDWGRPDIAGAFKRMAHKALTSMRRWQRPSGELWIVKNYADPAKRHGFEGYSFHSQYNLLAVAMLAIAYERADDSIAERPMPSEFGSYVFDLREPFQEIVAASGGTYVLINTGAVVTYDASGLMRIDKAGVALSPYTSNSAPARYQGPFGDSLKIGMTPGLLWKNSPDEKRWNSLADARRPAPNPNNPAIVESSELIVEAPTPLRVSFTVRYKLAGPGMRPLDETYTVDATGVEVATRLIGDSAVAQTRLLFPALVSDGARDSRITINGSQATITRPGGTLIWQALAPAGLRPALEGPRIATRNGYVQALVVDLPAGTREARWRVNLQPETSPVIPTLTTAR
jgi:hypothetical protein